MGNYHSQVLTNGSAEDEGGDPTRRNLMKSSSRSMRIFESKAAPLVILRDQSCQTGNSSVFGDNAMKSFSCTRVLLILAFAYAFVITLLVIFPFAQGIMIYLNIFRFPLGDLTKLDRFNLRYTRNIQTKTEDGYLLKGYHLLPTTSVLNKTFSQPLDDAVFDQLLKDADRVIIYFHGNAATRAAPIRLRCLKQLAVYFNAHILTFDYRGFGDSQGWPTERGTYRDGRAMISWLHTITKQAETIPQTAPMSSKKSLFSFFGGEKQSVTTPTTASPSTGSQNSSSAQIQKYPRLFLYGQSLGSGIATEMAVAMAAIDPSLVSGLILDAPFTTIHSAVSTHPLGAIFRIFPVVKNLMLWALQFQYNNIGKITSANTPVLFLHGAQDHKIPPYNSLKMQQALLRSGKYQAVDFRTQFLLSSNNSRNITCESKTCSLIPSQYLLLRSANHNSVHEAPEYIEAMEAFLLSAERFAASRKQ